MRERGEELFRMKRSADIWSSILREIIEQVGSIVLGKGEELEIMVSAVAAGGHVLVEGPPGIGKTLAVKALAKTIGSDYRRVQGNPDILPSDMTGFYIHTLNGDRRLVKGSVFTNFLQVDDVNMIPPRVHSALLQAMTEYRVSIEGDTFELERPFHVFATMIPPEIEAGVYEVSLGFLDRFWVIIRSGYVGRGVEAEIVGRSDELYLSNVEQLRTVMSREMLRELQDSLKDLVYADRRIANYIADIASYIRSREEVRAGPGHRGPIYLYRLSKAYALIKGRDYVVPDDVKTLAKYALPHRILLKPGIPEGKKEEIVQDALKSVSVPKE